ncbi:MAG: DNA repair protein RadC [Kiritimatiellia bacterium]|nr:DNA repair protein RadC [Kiritimatiellia bacterium]MDP6629504.1 DNA repair protein RadC [Kiritimatiellia bacterium]MDP6809211.1 DNA repair protein RadC [Kiritimatiellia bacterium]MDP7022950.1 DNA repair protein RadC [Kiritimatiellia bacterium]
MSTDSNIAYVIEPSRWQVRDIPAQLRPREAMERVGEENVTDDMLLAILLGSGSQGLNVVDLARGMLKHYDGSLTALAAASIDELMAFKGVGRTKAILLKAALETGRRLHDEALPGDAVVRTPEDVASLLGPRVRTLESEVFWVVHLNAKNVAKGRPKAVTQGLLNASLVHPREIFREAVRSSAAAVVLAHNHPSGDPTPSAEDIRITRQLIDAGKIVDIKVLDHVVLGRPGHDSGRAFMSMREEGLVAF